MILYSGLGTKMKKKIQKIKVLRDQVLLRTWVDTLRFVLEEFPYMLLTHAAPPQSHTHTTAQYYLKLTPLVALSENHCVTRNKIHNDSLSKFLECDRVGREAVQVTFEVFFGAGAGNGYSSQFQERTAR
jgi:hypothetical protein